MKKIDYIVHILIFFCSAISITSIAGQNNKIINSSIIKPKVSCESLINMDLSAIGGKGSKVNSAHLINNNGINYCYISGNLAPTIGFNVSLPTESWTQRYMHVGCGGLCGMISMTAGVSHDCAELHQGGFVTSATDMGHEGMSGRFGKSSQKRIDFAYRAVHLTAIASKEITSKFYGVKPQFSYFNGCSDGGREALMEAQRYPKDFNGIIAGAPAANFQVQNNIYHAWMAKSNTDKNGLAILTADRLPILHKAVLEQCDALDGIKDGLITDPRSCHFNVKSIQCPMGEKDSSKCLKPEEVEVVEKFYNGPLDPKTHEKLEISGPVFGSELNWAGVSVPFNKHEPIFSEMVSLDSIRYVSFENNPGDNYSLKQYKINKDTLHMLEKLHPLYDATNPNLIKFKENGGKLILWHGWADQHISPMNTIEYYNAIRQKMGVHDTENFVRLYMLPGVAHCGGGEGLSGINFVTPIMNWVENGVSPNAIMTYQNVTDNVTNFGQPNSGHGDKLPPKSKEELNLSLELHPIENNRSRPVYPYPYVAKYTGHGDINDGENYIKDHPLVPDSIIPTIWAGENIFKEYKAMN